MKILFITANRVGDAVLTTGLLAWLTNQYPEAYFTIACGPYGADIFRAVPRLDQLIIMKKKKWNGHWFDLWKQCSNTKWDLIVDLRNSAISRLLRATKRATHSRGSGRHKVVDNAAVLGLTPPPHPHIWITDEAMHVAESLLPHDKPILALAPAANWPPKQWPIEYFIHLIRELTAPGNILADVMIMVITDKHEREQVASLLQAIPHEKRLEIIGYNLQIAAACLKRARLFIGNDSGLMHLSAALGTPTLGLFGPGFPEIYGPWGEKCSYITTPESRDELVARLPNLSARAPNLMESLSVQAVAEATKKLLARIA